MERRVREKGGTWSTLPVRLQRRCVCLCACVYVPVCVFVHLCMSVCVCATVCMSVSVFVGVQYFPSHSSLLLEPEILTSTLTKRRLMKSSPLPPDRREYLFDQWGLSVCVCWEWNGEDVGFFSWAPGAGGPLLGLGGQQVEGEEGGGGGGVDY